jgi:hypothetical protein
MDEATTDDAFGGYGFAIRTFRFDVSDLHLHRTWSQNSLITHRPELTPFIKGKAVSEDWVGVIGRDGSVKEFNFTLKVNTDAKESWEWHKAHDVLAYTDHSKYKPEHISIKKLISERLDADPPTAALLTFDDDWETGIKAGWFIDCKVPPDIFSKLEDEIADETVTSIEILVRWEGGLVFDKYAPPSVPTKWGLFCLEEKRSPETLWGHVTSIHWSPTNQGKTNPREAREDIPVPTPAPVTAVAPVVFNVPKYAIAALWVLALATALHLFK